MRRPIPRVGADGESDLDQSSLFRLSLILRSSNTVSLVHNNSVPQILPLIKRVCPRPIYLCAIKPVLFVFEQLRSFRSI